MSKVLTLIINLPEDMGDTRCSQIDIEYSLEKLLEADGYQNFTFTWSDDKEQEEEV